MPPSDISVRLRLLGAKRYEADAARAGKATGKIGDGADRANRGLDRSSRSSGRAGRSFALLGGAAKTGGLALGFGLAVGAKKAIGAFEESRKVTAQTNAVIKSTGGIANVSAKDVEGLGTSLMKKTAIDDEAIKSGANMLLTFTRIRNEAGKGNDIFNQSTKAALDMSVAMGTDAKSSALMLGKALNDPEKGMTRLMRSGVTFTDQQKKQVKALQDSGDMLGAQKIILGEVNKEFGGSAAAAKTPLMALKTTVNEMFETIGGKLAPAVDAGAKALTSFVAGLSSGKGVGGEVAKVFKAIAASVGGFFKSLKGGKGSANTLKDIGVIIRKFVIPAFKSWARFVTPIFKGIAQQLRGFVMIVRGILRVFSAILRGDFRGAWQGVKMIFSGALHVIAGTLRAMTAPFRAAAGLIGRGIVAGFHVITGIPGTVGRVLGRIVGSIKGVPGKIASAAKGMFDGIKNAFKSAINFVIGGWNSLHFKIPGFDPPGPGPKFGGFTLGMPHINELAGGGFARVGSLSLVGERGPELMSVRPGGAQITPLSPISLPSGGDGGERTTVIPVSLDGQVITRVVAKHTANAKARR